MTDYLEGLSFYLCDYTFADFLQCVVERREGVLASGIATMAANTQEEDVKRFVKILC